ncbi:MULTISPECIES: extracellular catalytic domain type 1 short-chain-length polyhydroxyalkanoate depolymerase [Micromonospora]|uniref:extracellular catalytic domain type 1 short-chain-length polyhydroxyalkanoate depolymerase n=2 Tax=Micromonosporaceae TaxID=28056 RepID=UPI0009EE6E3F|nr:MULTISPECIES: PHB depolymerase family esterase [Micromonospora]MBP1784036.1 poly(hydroxyalkanoate) depolymerase family esterase [Micromonospora sp. HB375]MBQ1059367.1 PHB depolymerase family esterase [Micromonospora sp. C41]MDH6467028.1 poly(hydroxyalkanoate) depolymerase family esterase [Micromonospora sp. H404/HB375]WBB86955.1 PHB depolymerase family esterase [Micromonospora sp. WMMC264]WDQ01930.1 PHB depolymerase family esterase [Micromonospora chalcea]
MRIRAKMVVALAASLVAAGLVIPTVQPAYAASLAEVTSFGDNPGRMRMHVYVPDNRPSRPATVVAMHGCGGSGPGFYSGSEFAGLADRYGFIVIYPSATQQAGFGNCFDTWSDAAKRRGGGSDPVSLISMVRYVQQQYGADPDRVYATGSSSGGMMTNHMLALYPDVFKAGAAFMGVPFNCFAGASDYPPGSSQCTGGNMNRTPQQWGDAVRQAYPGYTGPRPRVQLWHGTNDTLVPYSLLQETIEQWTNVFGLSQNPTSTDTPQSGWNRRRYADSTGTVQVEAYSIQGAGHSLPSSGMAAAAIAFFGLTSTPGPTTPPPGPTTPPPGPTTPPPGPTTPPPGPTTPPPGTGACSVRIELNAWNNGLTENITISNTGSTAVNGWSLAFTLPGGQTITSGWNASYSPSSGQVTARNVSYNAAIPAGGSTTIGFQATHTGNAGRPSSFTLNGQSCTLT